MKKGTELLTTLLGLAIMVVLCIVLIRFIEGAL
jgi:hypothetical protein